MMTRHRNYLLSLLFTSPAQGHTPYIPASFVIKGVWIGADSRLQTTIVSSLHDSPMGGHSGFPVTYRRIKQLFAWSGMKAQIKSYVACCSVCQQAKADRSRYPGLLQPLPVPEQSWQVIGLDFIEGLPKSANVYTILVVIDTFSKYAHFLPLSHPFTAFKVAQLFLDSVYKLHGMPTSIISDRDRVFTSHLWQDLFRLSGTTLKMSSSYHPQIDGQTERINQCLETFLRSFVHACPSKWSSWLSLAEYWYNTSFHSSLGRSPFEVLYGHPPRHFGITVADASVSVDLQTWLTDRELMVKVIRQHLLRAQQRIKHQADKGRSEREFQVGDSVFLKLQPYVQTSVATRANHKLSFKYFGPYTVVQRIGKVAYKLQLPATAAIHPVFHVSQLKRALGVPPPLVSATLPNDLGHLQVPVQILNRRVVFRGGRQVPQVHVRWSQSDEALATWEDEDSLRARFPAAAAWGQAAYQGRGTVSDPVRRSTEDEAALQESRQPLGRRVRRPNVRVTGKEWAA